MRWTTRLARSACLLVGCLIVGCGADDGPVSSNSNETGTVSSVFDGAWVVSELTTDGAAVDGAGSGMTIEFRTNEAAVEGFTGCHRIFGSYTLTVDVDETGGTASFTMPGTETTPCSDADLAGERALVQTMESVTRWERRGSAIEFADPTGDHRLVIDPA